MLSLYLNRAASFKSEKERVRSTSHSCHRIGQLKPVTVDRLTIKNTVEQRIYDMQTRKQGLADAAFGEGKGASKSASHIRRRIIR